MSEKVIVIKGSDTLGSQLMPLLVNRFRIRRPDLHFEIASEGSSTGVLAVIEGAADIAMASRPVTVKETAAARRAGVELRERAMAIDGITVIVHPSNPVEDLSLFEVEAIFSGDIEEWSIIGGPPGRVHVFTRHSASGTYRIFKEIAMNKRDYTPRAQKMTSNEQIALMVARNPGAIAYVSLPQAQTASVKSLSINGFAPGEAAILDHRYPLSRPLYLVTPGGQPKPGVKAFMTWLRSAEAQQLIVASGFVPIESGAADELLREAVE